MVIVLGVWLSQLTEKGVALELTAMGPKCYKDDDFERRKNMRSTIGVRMVVLTLALAVGPLTGLTSSHAQTPGSEKRQDRRDDRQDARDTRQTGREDARGAKAECKKGDEKTRAECRQDKRNTKQDTRENARDIKKD